LAEQVVTQVLNDASAKVEPLQTGVQTLLTVSAKELFEIGHILTHLRVLGYPYVPLGHFVTHKFVLSSANTMGVAGGH